MIIIISYDKQVTLFSIKLFMDSYGVEHLLKMSHHTMHFTPKPQGAKQPHACILDSLNEFSKVIMDELFDALPPYRKVDHRIKVVHSLVLPSKESYRLNQKELEELKKKLNNLLHQRYIWQNKLSYGALVLFVNKNDKLKICID